MENEQKENEEVETEAEEKEDVNDGYLKNLQNKEVENGEMQSPSHNFSACISYTDDNAAIYTDPASSFKFKWESESNQWLPLDSPPCYENEYYKWCHETQQWKVKNKENESKYTSSDEQSDGDRVFTDKDGTAYIWDAEKKAWFPKIDEDFLAFYQMNYGFAEQSKVDESTTSRAEKCDTKCLPDREECKPKDSSSTSRNETDRLTQNKQKAGWFDIDPKHNTKVYVSNLPLDITESEFCELMSKCGMIMRDPQTHKYKVKLYAEKDGQLKGDGLCNYIKIESVELALKILDEYDLRGNKIKVQRAKFEMRGEYNAALKPKRRKTDKEKMKKLKERLFDWRPDKMIGERTSNEKVVIITNFFHPDVFEKHVELILQYQTDLREECSKCGNVRKVVIYDRNPNGVAQVNMSSPEEADLVIQMMDGRYFGSRRIKASHWDGKTKYKITESEQEEKQRILDWNSFLQSDKGTIPQSEPTNINT